MNDNTNISIKYKGVSINIDTPFSDYILNCSAPGDTFDEFVSGLERYSVKWWERFF